MRSESERLAQEIMDLKSLTQSVKARNIKLKMELERMQKEELCYPQKLIFTPKV